MENTPASDVKETLVQAILGSVVIDDNCCGGGGGGGGGVL
jgi:hypothetical protein